MTILTDSDLQDLSDMATELALTDTGSILRETLVDDGQGGSSRTWPVVFTSPCAVVDILFKPLEPLVAEQVAGEEKKMLLFPRQTAIRGNDRVTVKGTTYRVIEPLDPTTYEVLRRVPCVRTSLPQEDT